MRENIIQVLENIRVLLQRDGGDIEFVDVDDNSAVKVRLKGACAGCPMSQMTIKGVVEEVLRAEIDEKIKVINV